MKHLILFALLYLLTSVSSAASNFDETKALAEQGNVDAQFDLGYIYGSGQGVPQDYTEAVTWYRKAADQGYAPAQNNIGARYGKGQGVTQDYANAYIWSSLAVGSGYGDATKNRNLAASRL